TAFIRRSGKWRAADHGSTSTHMRNEPTSTHSAAYPAHPVMSIFSGERTVRFGAPSNSIFLRYSIT
ncbi:hypothetical protein QM312_35745, partial [Burkholderia cenocepacia]|uniref:hypothetical protein n=1 Tax=Burkholderia cenocepacia TaxID=95486 RepID=UPI0024B8292A